MRYDIDCKCGAQETRAGMNDFTKQPRESDGKVVTHRKCRACGASTPQCFRTAPAGHIDGASDAVAFRVPGLDGRFTSRKQVERAAEAQGKDLQHTSNGEWKRTKQKSRKNAEALATEMGYSSLGSYKEAMKNDHTAQVKANEAKERKGEARD